VWTHLLPDVREKAIGDLFHVPRDNSRPRETFFWLKKPPFSGESETLFWLNFLGELFRLKEQDAFQ